MLGDRGGRADGGKGGLVKEVMPEEGRGKDVVVGGDGEARDLATMASHFFFK